MRPYIRFILSSGAGKGRASELIHEIRRVYPQATHSVVGTGAEECGEVTISLTTGPDDIRMVASQWAEFHGDQGVCFLAGGDGSINEIASVLRDTGCAFGVLPAGTGNDFARTLYDGRVSPRFALQLVGCTRNAEVEPIDMLAVNDTFCVNLFSLGFDTEVLREALRLVGTYPWLGQGAYAAAVARLAFRDKSTPLNCEVLTETGEHVSLQQECTVLLVGNGEYYGSGYHPLPGALLDDGLADVLWADPLNLAQFGALLGSYRRGTHMGNSKLHHTRAREVSLSRTDGQDVLWNVDGIVYSSPEVHIRVLPGALNLARIPCR